MSLTKTSFSMIDGAPVNVLDYGAKGDGTTDDSAAIQAAIDAVVANQGGSIYIPNTGSSYIIKTGLTIASTPNSITFFGDGIWRSELKWASVSAGTFISATSLVYFKNMSLRGQPDSGDVFRSGDIGIYSNGVTNLDGVSLYGFQYGVQWVGGYYYHFTNCDFRYCDVVLYNFPSYNLVIEKNKVTMNNTFLRLIGGSGPTTLDSNSFEAFTSYVVIVASGTPQINFTNNYIENYPSTAVAAGLTGTYYNAGVVIYNFGNLVCEGNLFNCGGIFRVMYGTGTVKTIKSIGNVFYYQPTTSDTQFLYYIGVADNVQISDKAYATLTGQTGSYTTTTLPAVTLNSHPESSFAIDPYTNAIDNAINPWINATLQNSWANVDASNYQAASYKLVGNRVWLRGYVSGASATSSTMFTLPVGYRITTKTYRMMNTMNGIAGTPSNVVLRTDVNGLVFVSAPAGYTGLGNLVLDGLSFEID